MAVEIDLSNQQLFVQAFQYSPTGMVILAMNGSILKVNPAACAMLGFPENELLQMPFSTITHPQDTVLERELTDQLLAGSLECYQVEQRLFNKSNEIVRIQSNVSLITGGDGAPLYRLIQLVKLENSNPDLEECREFGCHITERERAYLAVLKNAFDFFTVHKPDGTMLYASPSCYEVLGYSPEEMIENPGLNYLHPEADGFQEHLALLQANKRISPIVRIRKKDGSCIWTESISNSITDPKTGKVVQIIVTSRDITDRITFEHDLQHNEQRYSSLFNHHPDLIYSMDLNGNYLTINQAFENTMEYTKQEIKEQPVNFRALVDPECLPLVEHHFDLATQGIAQRYEAKTINKTSHYSIFDVTNIPIIVNHRIIGVYGIARDITYQKELMKQLEESQRLYRIISENAQDIITFASPDRVIRYVSPSIKGSLGYEPDEYVGKLATDIWHPDDADLLDNNGILQNSDVDIFICRARHKQGHYVWFETTVNSVRNEAGELVHILAVSRDITSRKQAETVMKAAKDQLESFIDHNVDPILIMDVDNRAVRVNRAFEALFGWTASEIVGLQIPDLPNIPPSLKPEVIRNLAKIKSNETLQGYESVRKRKDGVDLKVSLSSFCMRDENGNINGWAVIMRDITDKKKAEELMLQSEKLSIAGQLAAGIAHEIRNPITAIKGFIQLMKSGVVEKKMYFDIMTSEIERIEVILNELLILAKPQLMHLERKDIRGLLSQVTTLLDTQAIINNVQIITEFDSSIPHIQCDENQLKQVCINFIKNAIEAMPRGGNLVIQLTSEDNHKLLLRFKDQGCGIPENVLNKLGQPFYTTKENGTGLGFMVSKRIIENHNGEITVKSKENEGTTIEITFPVAQ